MKLVSTSTFIIVFTLLITGLSSCKTESPSYEFSLSNPIDIARVDEPMRISLPEDFLKRQTSDKDIALYDGEKWMPSQLIDDDRNGQWDELAFNINMTAKESKKLTMKYIDKGLMADHFTKQRVNIRLGEQEPPYKEVLSADRIKKGAEKTALEQYVMEGPAWENDKVAFRNYFDERNGIDIFGKRTDEMILDNVGHKGSDYHKIEDWGMDVLKVGTSLGAGGLGLAIKDSIYRIDEAKESKYIPIADGPVFGKFLLSHKGLVKSGNSYDINHEISIPAGVNYYTSKVHVKGPVDDTKLVSGIVNFKSDNLYTDSSIEGVTILVTFDDQAEDGTLLGMALMIKNQDFAQVRATGFPADNIADTYMTSMNIDQPVSFRFYSGWERGSGEFQSMESFTDFLKLEAMKYIDPIVVE